MTTSAHRLLLALATLLTLFLNATHANHAPHHPSLMTRSQRVQAMRRQVGGTYAIVGIGASNAPRVRRELRDLQQDTDLWNLYLIGLNRLQATPQNQLLSWYQISGIHGRPYVDWDGVGPAPGQQNIGYCTHTSILFPPWHRPYLVLYEQVLYHIIQQVVAEFNGSTRLRYQNAANRFAIPYWDWAAAPATGQSVLPSSISSAAKVSVTTAQGRISIDNPLYAYKFHPLDPTELPDSPLVAWPVTLRWPTNRSPSATSQNSLAASSLDNNRLSYRDRIYNLFTAYHNYTEFSNKAWYPGGGGNYDSLESVHDQIHGLTGGGGHMSYVPYSAFDPIFYLHHTMVDRVFTVWQALNPTSYVQPERTQFGTYSTPALSIEDANTKLAPFHSDDHGDIWTSNTARSASALGYTYPELANNANAASIRTAINKLYGASAPAAVVQHRSRRAKGRMLVKRENSTEVVASELPTGLVAADDRYYEYLTNIRVRKFALPGSFFVHIFLGDFSSDPFCWTFDANLVGSHCVFADTMAGAGNGPDPEVTGVIPLTTALLEAIAQGHLASLDPSDVEPFLHQHLNWRVALMDGTAIPNDQVDHLKVTVVSSRVKKPQSASDFPEWGAVSAHPAAIANRSSTNTNSTHSVNKRAVFHQRSDVSQRSVA
ncbi:MAG: hypothetical protein M1826_004170 [Phylliscum demangeonii]|nr:MAG: hypothetical protein M1826_004170 [Phylliscum demangeonii]